VLVLGVLLNKRSLDAANQKSSYWEVGTVLFKKCTDFFCKGLPGNLVMYVAVLPPPPRCSGLPKYSWLIKVLTLGPPNFPVEPIH